MRGVLAAAVCVAALAAAGSATAGLVTARVPAGQTVAELRYQQFIQRVTCARTCDATTIVSIAGDDARRLGYTGEAPWVAVASSYARVQANRVTEIHFVVNAQGRRLLSKAKGKLHVVGRLTAFPRGNPKALARVSWSAILK